MEILPRLIPAGQLALLLLAGIAAAGRAADADADLLLAALVVL